MNPLSYLLAPMLLLPLSAEPEPVVEDAPGYAVEAPAPRIAFDPAEGGVFQWLAQAFRIQSADQVRIEQRVIIRIAPRGNSEDIRRNLLADLPSRAIGPHFEERSMGKCVPVAGVAGVQVAPENKLVLFLRDQRIVSAGMEKGCNVRDFYSGFLIERTSDGMMCAGRDKLLSRNGASCKLGKMHQLVEVGE